MIDIDLGEMIAADEGDGRPIGAEEKHVAGIFNNLEAERRAAEIRKEVEAGPQDWRKTIHIRWAQFVLRQNAQSIGNIAGHLDLMGVTPTPDALVGVSVGALGDAQRSLAQVAGILAGSMVADPVECEVNLRLNAWANAGGSQAA